MTATDLVVRDAVVDPETVGLGRGLNVQLGARVVGERMAFERTSEVAILVGTGSELEATDLAVR
nr:hypothetical protein [Actinomycetota bacterium]NIU69884.1 hypothetical protein [Actinomycetota bacterium]NIW31764.1 hypothetical protein [Actinomycetota bacterium]